MAMTHKQAAQLIMHLGRIGRTACPVCGTNDHVQQEAGNIILPPVLTSHDTLVTGDPREGALAELQCLKCGYTMLFDCKIASIDL